MKRSNEGERQCGREETRRKIRGEVRKIDERAAAAVSESCYEGWSIGSLLYRTACSPPKTNRN
jgi:hypothetical protein